MPTPAGGVAHGRVSIAHSVLNRPRPCAVRRPPPSDALWRPPPPRFAALAGSGDGGGAGTPPSTSSVGGGGTGGGWSGPPSGGGKGGGGGGSGPNPNTPPPPPPPPRLPPHLLALLAGAAGGAALVAALSSSSPPGGSRDPDTGAALPAHRDVPVLLSGLAGEVGALRRLLADAYGALHALDKRVAGLEPPQGGEDGHGGGFFGSPLSPSGGGPPAAVAGATRAAAAAARFPALADLRRRTGGARSLRTGAGTLPSSGVAVEGEVACTAALVAQGGGLSPLLAAVLDTGDSAGPGPATGPPSPGSPALATLALHGAARGGRDAWLALADVGSGGDGGRATAFPFPATPRPASPSSSSSSAAPAARLTKASYSWQVTRRGRVTLTPLGGWGGDAAPTLHPSSGTGLSAAARRGCAAHASCAGGPSVSARYRWRDAGVTAARFGGRGGGDDGCTLLQVDGAPVAGLSLGLAAVVGGGGHGGGRPPPARAASDALPAASSDWASDATSVGPGGEGSHPRHPHSRPRARLAALACCPDVWPGGAGPPTSLSGWVSAELGGAASPSPAAVADRAWGATLACPPDKSAPGGLGWAMTVAGGGGVVGGGGHDPHDDARARLMAEAGLTVPLGAGAAGSPAGALFPSVILVRGAGGRSAALVGVRSSWGF